MSKSSKLKRLRLVNTTVGVLFAAATAAVMSYFFRGTYLSSIVPLLFVGLVTLVALQFGVAAGVLGCVVSALIFALFLLHPVGSVAVAASAARSNLGWLLLGGISLSFLFAPQQKE